MWKRCLAKIVWLLVCFMAYTTQQGGDGVGQGNDYCLVTRGGGCRPPNRPLGVAVPEKNFPWILKIQIMTCKCSLLGELLMQAICSQAQALQDE